MADARSTGGTACRVDAAGCTDAGPVRTVNEDRWMIDAGLGLYVVADGMGGHQAGEVASQLAVAEVAADIAASGEAGFEWPLGCDRAQSIGANRVRHALLRANDAVFAAGAADPALVGMGTTVTALLVTGDEAVVGSVGDSRAYLVRDAQARLLTHDDTWLASVLGADGARDAAARAHPMRHVLTNVIGTRGGASPEVVVVSWQSGDVAVLATDGLHNVVDDERIGALASDASVAGAARALVDDAVRRGTTDNVTVVIVRRA